MHICMLINFIRLINLVDQLFYIVPFLDLSLLSGLFKSPILKDNLSGIFFVVPSTFAFCTSYVICTYIQNCIFLIIWTVIIIPVSVAPSNGYCKYLCCSHDESAFGLTFLMCFYSSSLFYFSLVFWNFLSLVLTMFR